MENTAKILISLILIAFVMFITKPIKSKHLEALQESKQMTYIIMDLEKIYKKPPSQLDLSQTYEAYSLYKTKLWYNDNMFFSTGTYHMDSLGFTCNTYGIFGQVIIDMELKK